MLKRMIGATLLCGGLLGAAQAQELTIEVTNLTGGVYYTPLLVSAHNAATDLFEAGEPASPALRAMAEGGDLGGLVALLEAAGADNAVNPAGGLLGPGETATAYLSTGRKNRYLSVVAMLLPTNDGFVGLDAVRIPRHHGRYTWYVNGYDAGTEANNEIVNGGGAPGVPGIPADPGGGNGMGAHGVTALETNPRVHIHPGVIGDSDPTGGASDLDPAVHRWLNPVARVVVTVHKREHDDDD